MHQLIGYQLVSIDENKIVVKNKDQRYILEIVDDPGDCCGYNSIEASLFISEEELARNPVITNVMIESKGLDDWAEGKITFFGEDKKMATLSTLSSSGSGWAYGACVVVRCKMLDVDFEVSHW